MKRNNFVLVIFTIMTFSIISFSARAECPLLPQISWWGQLSHESVTNYVRSNHNGDWEPYVDKWRRQLSKLQDIHAKGGAIKTPNGSKLEGSRLANYISKVSQRSSVNECLAREYAAARADKTKEASNNGLLEDQEDVVFQGNPAEGKAVAEQAGCFKCHRKSGRSLQPEVPNLAGQKPFYLVKQLLALSSSAEGMLPTGDRTYRFHEGMSKKLDELSEADMRNIAAFFASL